MSLLDPLACGFAKVAVFELLIKDQGLLGKGVSKIEKNKVFKAHLERFSLLIHNINS